VGRMCLVSSRAASRGRSKRAAPDGYSSRFGRRRDFGHTISSRITLVFVTPNTAGPPLDVH
jgi:hypothetical protein